ncbi:MAG: type II secretion system secretin GspD [Deltaproteobacteria bacterium]|nr:type II secretion system secretin GspD [Deltaproteobacteria bacterium]
MRQHPNHLSQKQARTNRWSVVLAALLTCLLVLSAGGTLAQQPPPPTQPPPQPSAKPTAQGGGDMIEMNFKNVDIVNFLSIMSDSIGVPFVWNDQDIKGKITVVSPGKFSRRDAYKLFETVLAMHGYTTVRHKGSPAVQVVPMQDAARLPSPTLGNDDTSGGMRGGNFQTRIITLKYADPNQVKATITPLISKQASLAAYPPANVLILSDVEDNVTRMMEIVSKLDVEPGDVTYQMITLKHASARKLAQMLTEVTRAMGGGQGGPAGRVGARTGGGGGVTVVADDRINALIVVADPSTLAQVTKLVEAVDVPGKTETSGFKVYTLKHASAEDLEKVLTRVKSGAEKMGRSDGAPPQPGGPPEGLTITSDKSTNSLIVLGPPDMLLTMDQIISQLDTRRPQVYVEALIMEVTLDKSLALGVDWQANSPTPDGMVGGGFPSATPNTPTSLATKSNGAVLGMVGNNITFNGQSYSSFGAFIQATRQDQDLNILANPQILTLDNQEAEINVSQVIPVSSKVVTSVNQTTTTEFEFKDVGIILRITPQITGQDKVLLKINQESSSVAAKQVNTTSKQQAITTLKRTIHNTVLIDNDTTMAIGGLIHETTVLTETKVPLLGDIPVLSILFKSKQEQLQKTNLIIFIRPTIINNRDDLQRVTHRVQERFDTTQKPKPNPKNQLKKEFQIDEDYWKKREAEANMTKPPEPPAAEPAAADKKKDKKKPKKTDDTAAPQEPKAEKPAEPAKEQAAKPAENPVPKTEAAPAPNPTPAPAP